MFLQLILSIIGTDKPKQKSSAMLNERSRAYLLLLTFGVLLLKLRSSSAGKTLAPKLGGRVTLSFPHSQDTLKKMSVPVGS